MLKLVLNAYEFPMVTCNTSDVTQGEDLVLSRQNDSEKAEWMKCES